MEHACDIAVVGAGAAGLMAAVHAARAAPSLRVLVLEGQRRLGAKILIAGGGRCNVTHDVVDETAFAGGSRQAIRKVLRRYDVPEVLRFFAERGVEMVREPNGKLFPATNRARTVLDALVGAAREAGAEILHPFRVETVGREAPGFLLAGPAGTVRARAVILATGGRSVPQTGSDGHGHVLARSLGHALTPRIFPALVPLLLPAGHPLTGLAGIALDVRLEVRGGTGRRVAHFDGALLLTHFGLSGPVVLDASRWWLDARADDPGAALVVAWLPDASPEALDEALRGLGARTVESFLRERVPVRLAATIARLAGVEPATPGDRLRREERRALVQALLGMELPVTGPRGWAYAEVTAGGVPLPEVRLETLESRVCPGLFLCGEVLDVDGRIGGYNFQWAWSSGWVAGRGAAAALSASARGSARAPERPR